MFHENKKFKVGLFLVLSFFLSVFVFGPSARAAETLSENKDFYVMPYDVDPPIVIDGKLDDWENVPNAIVLNKKEQVTYQVGKVWTGPDDLSGTIHLAWRDGIYIAAEVSDDVVQQPYSGAGIYKGDHINLWIDFKPTREPNQVLFGEGQYHIAVSPGNFGGTAGAPAIPPEIIIYQPEGLPSEEGEVAARRTEKGYVIEAFVPFSRLKIENPKADQYVAFEVAIGESDSTPARQETFMTFGTAQWKYLRSRMMPMAFGSGSGKAVLPAGRITTPGAKFFKSAPTGGLPVYEPQTSFPKTYSGLKQENDRISLEVGKDGYFLESRFSTPDGEWQADSASSRQAGTNKFFSHKRELIEHDEWIEVRDTFRNLTQDNLPIIQEHKCVFAKEAEGVWFAGIKKPFKTGRISGQSVFENGSVFATVSGSGIGLVPLNDEFMVHIELAGDQGKWVQIADPFFVLKKGGEYTAEWAIVPVPKPDYYAFVNAARRMLDTNFTLKYMFAFLFGNEMLYKWGDADIKKFMENKSANLMVQSNDVHPFNGTAAHGTAFLKVPRDGYIHFQERARRIWPDRSRKTAVYYHCFLDVDEASVGQFASDRILDANGIQVGYGGPNDKAKEYLPTLENKFGKEMAKVVDVILDEIKADGIYWDEFSFSKVEYDYSKWDGCSADIDLATHKITRLKGSLPLLSQDFRAAQVKKVLDRGGPLIVNSQPFTRTIRRFKFQAFVETGSGPIACMKTHLYSPVILGDHLTEETYKEIYQNMLQGLDYGCLYAYYYIRPMPNKTLAEYMYPFTPIELHEGYVIGRERILTNRSGQFGWGDNSDFAAHVYDRDSKATDGSEVKKVKRNGKTYAEVRIPEGYSAAIVRKSK